MSAQSLLTAAFWLVPIVFAAGSAWLALQNARADLRGVSKKCNRIVGMLVRWEDLNEAERNKAIADFLEGK